MTLEKECNKRIDNLEQIISERENEQLIWSNEKLCDSEAVVSDAMDTYSSSPASTDILSSRLTDHGDDVCEDSDLPAIVTDINTETRHDLETISRQVIPLPDLELESNIKRTLIDPERGRIVADWFNASRNDNDSVEHVPATHIDNERRGVSAESSGYCSVQGSMHGSNSVPDFVSKFNNSDHEESNEDTAKADDDDPPPSPAPDELLGHLPFWTQQVEPCNQYGTLVRQESSGSDGISNQSSEEEENPEEDAAGHLALIDDLKQNGYERIFTYEESQKKPRLRRSQSLKTGHGRPNRPYLESKTRCLSCNDEPLHNLTGIDWHSHHHGSSTQPIDIPKKQNKASTWLSNSISPSERIRFAADYAVSTDPYPIYEMDIVNPDGDI